MELRNNKKNKGINIKNIKVNDNKKLSLIFLFIYLLVTPFLFSEEDLSIEDIRELQELKLGESVINDKQDKFLELQTTVQREEEEVECLDCIYGYDLFVDTPTTFALSTNTPIPQDYILGPGDKLTIQYFGNNKRTDVLYQEMVYKSSLLVQFLLQD